MQKVRTQKSNKSERSHVSPTGREILEFLRSRGGRGAVGIIGSNRTATIKHLRRLEEQGLIVCVREPEKRRLPNSWIGQLAVDLHCGVWQIKNAIAEAPAGKIKDGQIFAYNRENH